MDKLIINCYNYSVLDKMLECETVEEMKKLLEPKPKSKKSDVDYCCSWKMFRLLLDDYFYMCPGCGETANGSVRESNENEVTKWKSVHLSSKGILKRLKDVVKHEHVGMVNTDFMQVVCLMISKSII